MEEQQTEKGIDRRNFIRVAGAGLTAAGVALTPAERAIAQFKTDKDRFERIASCTWPIRSIFKQRAGGGRGGGGGGRGAGAGAPATPAGAAAAPAGAQAGATQTPAAVPGGGRGGDAAPVAQRSPANGGWSTERMKEKY